MAGETILIVEDEPAVARGLEYALTSEGYETLLASTGGIALEVARRRAPKLILLDIRLPDVSGFDVCRQLRAEGKRMPILMLTARDEEVDRVLGLELGADDYVVKPFSLRELISRIRALLRRAYGDLSLDPEAEHLNLGQVEVDLERLEVRRGGRVTSLTPTEDRILRYLVSHPGRHVSREEVIEAVWGYDSSIGSSRSVDVHIRHLRSKLEDEEGDPRWIVTVRGVGYMFEP